MKYYTQFLNELRKGHSVIAMSILHEEHSERPTELTDVLMQNTVYCPPEGLVSPDKIQQFEGLINLHLRKMDKGG